MSSSELHVRELRTPPVACMAPSGVFDAFGWCESDRLEWRRPRAELDGAGDAACLDGSDPQRMAFVLKRACDFLPRELARLHAIGLGLKEEEALAPWGIDDATDELYARRARPRDMLWLAADNLNALFWGLHDWAHFHNHGPFEQRAWTEFQCDATALAWLWMNLEEAGLTAAAWERVREHATALSRARFAAEGLVFDETLMAATGMKGLVRGRSGPELTDPAKSLCS